MRILVVGAGGVGSAVAPIAARRDFFEQIVVADYDVGRASAVVGRLGDPRFVGRAGRRLRAPGPSPPSAGRTASPTSSTPSIRGS